MYSTSTELVVRYAETDQMGIVHHSVYPVWYEAGRTEFIRKAGISYSEIEEMGLLLPLIELNVKYMGSSQFEDIITVETTISNFSATRITFSYKIYIKNDKKVINEGTSSHVWTDMDLKPVNLRKRNPKLYEMMLSVS